MLEKQVTKSDIAKEKALTEAQKKAFSVNKTLKSIGEKFTKHQLT
jgi:hypothetical protein